MIRKFLFIAWVLGLSSAALVGCRVEGEVGDEVTSHLPSPR
jgi:hypothetical protein